MNMQEMLAEYFDMLRKRDLRKAEELFSAYFEANQGRYLGLDDTREAFIAGYMTAKEGR